MGILPAEIGPVVPFVPAGMAALSKSVRNWKTNAKGAGLVMGAIVAARVMHWLKYHDEEWWNELSPTDKYKNFTIGIGGKPYRVPGPFGWSVVGGGAVTYALDKAFSKNPNFAGYVQESVNAMLPPAPFPPAIKAPAEVGMNTSWAGSPIVPRRDEDLPALDKFTEYQGPYLAKQFTGGRADPTVSGLIRTFSPVTEVRNATRSINDFYGVLKDLEGQRVLDARKGLAVTPELTMMRRISKKIGELSKEYRSAPPARQRQIRQDQIELAKQALP